jgi:hypothetical protein
MAKLVWDQTGERLYETGVDRGVVYPQVSGAYPAGAAWNGLINVTESPSGAEASPLYANNRKYAELMSAEEFGGSIEAYTYPDEFAECDGSKEMVPGVSVKQQPRKPFGMTYRVLIGNDTEKTAYGYKLHLVYGALAAPSERAHASINDSPEAETMSWEFTTTPVEIDGFDPAAHIEIDSTKVDAEKLKALEDILYGTESEEARLPLPSELATIFGNAS